MRAHQVVAAAAVLLIGAQGQARLPLNAKQRGEVRREIRSLMNYHFRLYSSRRPGLSAKFTDLGNNRVRVDASLNAVWRGERGPQVQRFGIIKVKGDGSWSFVKGSSYRQLHSPTDPRQAVKVRDGAGDAAVIGRSGQRTRVLYDRRESGDIVKIAAVDKVGRIVESSRNLAPDLLGAALSAHRSQTGRRHSWATLSPFSTVTRGGRSITVDVYSANFAGSDASWRTTYRIGVTKEGLPSGRVKQVSQTYLR